MYIRIPHATCGQCVVCEVAGVRSFFFTGMSSSVISCRFYGLSIYFLFNCSVLIIYTVLGTKVGGGGGGGVGVF